MKTVVKLVIILVILSLFTCCGNIDEYINDSTNDLSVDHYRTGEPLLDSSSTTTSQSFTLPLNNPTGTEQIAPTIINKYYFVEFSDLHETYEDSEGHPVLSVLATNLKNIDKENNGRTLILSGGDNVDRSLEKFQDDVNSPIMEILAEMGVDATALGNREFEVWGINVLLDKKTLQKTHTDKSLVSYSVPVLCANLLDSVTLKPIFTPFKIYVLDKLKVAVIGSSSTKINDRFLKDKNKSLIYIDHVEAINQYAKEIQKSHLADIVIALVHEGGKKDEDGNYSGTLISVAKDLVGVNLVFGGDTHTIVNTTINGMPVIVPGSHGNGFMEVILEYDEQGIPVFSTRYTSLDSANSYGYRAKPAITDDNVDRLIEKLYKSENK